jgi:N-acetylmuramoyl-L-alanine amidase
MKIALSVGHGQKIRGASGIIDEVDEAYLVVQEVGRRLGKDCVTFFDTTSTDQSQNLETIVDWHNNQAGEHDLDVSLHFNAFEGTMDPRGTECWYLTARDEAARVVNAIAWVGFINRGVKQTDELYFLSNTTRPAILIELCFVDSQADVEIYQMEWAEICALIALALQGVNIPGVA